MILLPNVAKWNKTIYILLSAKTIEVVNQQKKKKRNNEETIKRKKE
jgi:hypothetical protein